MRNSNSKSVYNRITRSITREGFIALLISVLIAFVFWIFKSLDQMYQYELNVQLKHTELPEGKIFKYPMPESLVIRFEGSGWDIIKSKRLNKKASVNLDLQMFSDVTEVRSAQLVNQRMPDELSNIVLLSISPEKLNIQFDKVGNKTLKVFPDVDLSFDKEHGLSGPIQTVPDEVIITGPSSEIMMINEVYTDKLKFSNVKEVIDQTVAIRMNPNSNITCSENTVQLHIPVEQLSEGSLVLPILLPGHMSDSISLIPDRVTVRFQAALSIYNSISSLDLYPVVKKTDIEKSNGGKIKVYVKLNNPYVNKARLSPDYVDFIITK